MGQAESLLWTGVQHALDERHETLGTGESGGTVDLELSVVHLPETGGVAGYVCRGARDDSSAATTDFL